MWKNTQTNYGAVSRFLHWGIFFLLLVMIPYGYFLGDVPKAYQGLAYNVHKLMGLTILLLMILRVIWSLTNLKPAQLLSTPIWQRWTERSVHFLLYAAIIAMPVVGWVGSIAAGHPPHIGRVNLNLPVEQSKPLADTAFDMHSLLAIIIMVFVGMHMLAALYHHFIKKDNVLRRMWLQNSRS